MGFRIALETAQSRIGCSASPFSLVLMLVCIHTPSLCSEAMVIIIYIYNHSMSVFPCSLSASYLDNMCMTESGIILSYSGRAFSGAATDFEDLGGFCHWTGNISIAFDARWDSLDSRGSLLWTHTQTSAARTNTQAHRHRNPETQKHGD